MQTYVKRHLVPFGEYFPVPSFIRSWMRMMNLPASDALPGVRDQPPLDAAGQRIAVTICYEDVFGAEQLHYLPVATLLVDVSNDAWFGDSTASHQHLEVARMRSLEAGRYQMRVANDGITAIIDPRGAVKARIPRFKAEVLRGSVVPYRGLTPYASVGNWPIVALCIMMLLIALVVPRLPIGHTGQR